MNRRQTLVSLMAFSGTSWTLAGDWGASKGYPTGWPPKNAKGGQPMPWTNEDYMVGNFSGGIESIWPTRLVKAGNEAFKFKQSEPLPSNLAGRLKQLQISSGKPAILVIRKGAIVYENYEFGRTQNMRFFGMSMAKSVLSLLVGICLKEGVIKNLNVPVSEFAGSKLGSSELGAITIQNAMNMSGGSNICVPNHCSGSSDDFSKFAKTAKAGHPLHRLTNTSVEQTLRNWTFGFKYPQGERFEYNPVDPSLIGVLVSQVSGGLLSNFMSEKLWKPMGAEADGSWSLDSLGHELVDGSFAATLRDWGRLGLLVAQKGRINGHQIVSEEYIRECRNTSNQFGYLAPGNISHKLLGAGYKNFFHLPAESKNWLKFQGGSGQTILCDLESESVLVVLSVSNSRGFDGTYESLFGEIVRL